MQKNAPGLDFRSAIRKERGGKNYLSGAFKELSKEIFFALIGSVLFEERLLNGV